MEQVRSQLGRDALIIHTRGISEGIEIAVAVEAQRTEISGSLPGSISTALTYHSVPELIMRRLGSGHIHESLERIIRFDALSISPGSRPVLFAGPPGAGKTLTVARLAARLVLGGSIPVIVTTDAQRAGGGEQLFAFTRLLGVDLIVTASLDEMRASIRQRAEGTPVLIDLPGGTPFHRDEQAELAGLAEAISGTIAAVLPAGVDPYEATDLAHGYRECGAHHLVATRLDLARRIGGVIAAAAAGLALAEAGIGPGIADGMVPMSVNLLVRFLMKVPPSAVLALRP